VGAPEAAPDVRLEAEEPGGMDGRARALLETRAQPVHGLRHRGEARPALGALAGLMLVGLDVDAPDGGDRGERDHEESIVRAGEGAPHPYPLPETGRGSEGGGRL